MKFNPIALFTTLTVAAAGAAGYVALNPAIVANVKPPASIVAPAPAPVAEAPKVEVPAVKPEEQVAAATQPVAQPAPAPATPVAPSFDTVRVETGGEAVIAGRAEPQTEVVAKLNGEIIASATASADGSFVMIPAKPLPAGAGVLSLESKSSGTVMASSDTVAVAVKPKGEGESTVAVMTPDQPTKVLQAPASPSNSVVLDAVDYNAAGDIVFSGRSQPGTSVRLYVDNAIAGEVKADDLGKWTYAGQSEVAAGTHTLRADAIAADGSVSSRVELPFLREAPAKVAETAAPVVAPAPAAPATPAVVAEVPAAAATPVAPVAPVVAAATAAPQPTKIVIQPGNNLWTLSRELYGYGKNYTVIYEANKDQIRNPRLIFPGQILTAPVALAKTP